MNDLCVCMSVFSEPHLSVLTFSDWHGIIASTQGAAGPSKFAYCFNKIRCNVEIN